MNATRLNAMRLTTSLLFACVLTLGCGEVNIGDPPTEDTAGPGVDVGTPPVDTQGTDTGTSDVGEADTSGPEDTSTDAGVDTTPPDCEGEVKDSGCPCDSNDECASSFCFITSDGKECAQLCDSTCPEGYECSPVTVQGGDPIFICVQRTLYYCMPCSSNSDCIVPGFEGDDECLSYGEEGSFCGLKCGTGTCPAGSNCVDGQCKTDSGTCDCAPLFKSLAAKTDCEVSNELGTCGGQRQCGPDGLSECDALTPAFDTCDGIDNDCDGILDEDCAYQLRGRMMGGGFVIGNDPTLTLKGSTGTPRVVGTTQGGGYILRAGFPPP